MTETMKKSPSCLVQAEQASYRVELNSPAICILLSILNGILLQEYNIASLKYHHLIYIWWHCHSWEEEVCWGALGDVGSGAVWATQWCAALANCFILETTHSLTLVNTTHFLLPHRCEFSFNDGSFFNTGGSLFRKQFVPLLVSSKGLIDPNYTKVNFNMSYLPIGVAWLFLRKCEQWFLLTPDGGSITDQWDNSTQPWLSEPT